MSWLPHRGIYNFSIIPLPGWKNRSKIVLREGKTAYRKGKEKGMEWNVEKGEGMGREDEGKGKNTKGSRREKILGVRVEQYG